MRRLLLVLLLIHSSLCAGELVRCPDPNLPLPERVHRAIHTATDKSFWTGYSVMRLMSSGELFLSGVSFSGEISFRNKPTLQEWINGIEVLPKQDLRKLAESELNRLENGKSEKVWKEIGIFQRFQRGSSVPDKTEVISLNVSHKFDGPLYWFGNVSHDESFQYLSSQYSHAQKEDLVAAIGVHPAAQAFPFFKKILKGKDPREVQETAAVLVGEFDTPEALALLLDVTENNPWKDVRESAVAGISEMDTPESLKVLSQIALSNSDPDLRETAMAMLSDKKDPLALSTLEKVAWFDSDSSMRETAIAMLGESDEAVPVLLKIVEEHPSQETREVAVRMLAESIAGREVLKKKIRKL